ncbi:hypothetical protein QVZ41_10930 [Wenyingzhuangia sp. chi5]|uniref:PKD domain-containing protein n=1 Tax=Wenyingzhuangia gilva TaxID=3057677 RepID=A0ABT8VTR3_9FLAO|nr:hypothetical protein [Wenyingzhuangia sp. chi5]MDO3695352.1 hypothetical protein [Wenyingzhuangia sp. chi5]
MKTKIYNFILICISAFSIAACNPVEDRIDTPDVKYNKENLEFSVTQNSAKNNEVTMTSSQNDVIPFWSYTNSNGDELGHSNKKVLEINFPFAGDYNVYYTAYTRGGAVEADPIVLNVTSNDDSYFSASEWQMLTNGVNGKTWVLDMQSPLGFAGLDFPNNPSGSDYWNWYPDYAGNEWLLENKDWGEMTFDLNGGYNVSVTQTSPEAASTAQTTKTGTYSFDIDNDLIIFNGGVGMLYGGNVDQFNGVSNWAKMRVLEISETSMRLAVVRDQHATEGVALLVYHFKPKN